MIFIRIAQLDKPITIGAIAISFAVAPEGEQSARRLATRRECDRYCLDVERVEAALSGGDPLSVKGLGRRWWDGVIVVTAIGIFLLLAAATERPPFTLNARWAAGLLGIMLASLFGCGYLLWRRTRFS